MTQLFDIFYKYLKLGVAKNIGNSLIGLMVWVNSLANNLKRHNIELALNFLLVTGI